MRIPTARLIVCLAVTGVAASCAGSSSAPEVSALDKSFLRGISSYDQNRDGIVTCDEWRAAAGNLFTTANKSGSGVLTEDEFRDMATVDRTFLVANSKFYDANRDGKVDKKEFVERPNPAFAYADKDKDCRLSEPELLAVRSFSAPPKETPRPSAIGNGQPNGSGGGY